MAISLSLSFADLLSPEAIVQYGGLTLLLLIIFAETGLFVGFFLPGDSLLFIAGVLCQSRQIDMPVGLLIVIVIIAAISGTTVGYGFGYWAEGYLKNLKENFFYKRKYLEMTDDFYKRYGMMAFIGGRFLPVVRTFIPILAGIVKINFSKFIIYNIIGAVIWVTSLIVAGFWAGNTFPFVSENLELIVAGMILLTALPLIISFLKNHVRFKKQTHE